MNKKVLTITCHNVYNYGASLQEYALLKFLEEKGYEASTINYTPPYLSGHFNFFSVDNPKFKKNIYLKIIYIILKAPFKILDYPRKKKFDAFSKKYIKETKKRYHSSKELEKEVPIADIYICGSDQIWNSYFQNGKDSAFYLNFVPNDKLKISYAPSFAIDKIEPSLKDFVFKSVSSLDAVSVREISGKKILRDLGIENVTQVLDPVFLLEKNKWEALCYKPIEKNYILIYDFDNNPLIKRIALKLKKQKNLQIITLSKNISYADKNYYKEGPQYFLTLIRDAEYVLANSFHAVAFSLIFQKQFFVFNRNISINTRMRDLLEILNLNDRLIKEVNIDFSKRIDYTKINKIINEKVEKSKKFLIQSLMIKK